MNCRSSIDENCPGCSTDRDTRHLPLALRSWQNGITAGRASQINLRGLLFQLSRAASTPIRSGFGGRDVGNAPPCSGMLSRCPSAFCRAQQEAAFWCQGLPVRTRPDVSPQAAQHVVAMQGYRKTRQIDRETNSQTHDGANRKHTSLRSPGRVRPVL